jgi:hypothetical protein
MVSIALWMFLAYKLLVVIAKRILAHFLLFAQACNQRAAYHNKTIE